MTLCLSDLGRPPGHSRVTHSRHRAVISGNQRTRRRQVGIQEEHGGYGRNWLDTLPRRFGTVRPRVQIPGPRPISELKSIQLAELT
jgi:hypothetical protein